MKTVINKIIIFPGERESDDNNENYHNQCQTRHNTFPAATMIITIMTVMTRSTRLIRSMTRLTVKTRLKDRRDLFWS